MQTGSSYCKSRSHKAAVCPRLGGRHDLSQIRSLKTQQTRNALPLRAWLTSALSLSMGATRLCGTQGLPACLSPRVAPPVPGRHAG